MSDFGIAGLKDKYADTKQYITVPSKYEIKESKDPRNTNFSAKFMGHINKAIRVGDLIGNRFRVVVRDIVKGEIDGVMQKAESISTIGMPNYFDSQRFGSLTGSEFIGKCIIKKDYERAVKIFLTEQTKFEKSQVKLEKKLLLRSWGRWDDFARVRVNTRSLFVVKKEYDETGSWIRAYQKVSPNLREMHIAAYQSYLWNECIKELLRQAVDTKNLYGVTYKAGTLLFYKKLSKEEESKLPETFTTISDEINLSDMRFRERKIIEMVLSKEDLYLDDFQIKKETGNFFKANSRPVIIKPAKFSISRPEVDELNNRPNKSRFKITLSFELLKGSYATIVTKRLFGQ